jgi:hypothetical protein
MIWILFNPVDQVFFNSLTHFVAFPSLSVVEGCLNYFSNLLDPDLEHPVIRSKNISLSLTASLVAALPVRSLPKSLR